MLIMELKQKKGISFARIHMLGYVAYKYARLQEPIVILIKKMGISNRRYTYTTRCYFGVDQIQSCYAVDIM